MKNRKLLILVIIILITNILQAQTADEQISTLFANNDFFKLKAAYPALKEQASKPMQLFIEAYLCTYFNQPEQAGKSISTLLSDVVKEYPHFLTSEHQLLLAVFWAENEAKLQNYENAASIYSQLIEQLAPHWNEEDLKSYKMQYHIYLSLQNVPKMEISYLDTTATIPLKEDTIGLLKLPVKGNNPQAKFDFVLDFGAGYCITEEKYAKSLGINVLKDSFSMKTGIGTDEYCKIGLAYELMIGDVRIKNVVFLLYPDKILKDLPDTASHYEINGIIGFPVLSALEHLKIAENQLVVSKSVTKPVFSSNMMTFSNQIFVQSISNEDTLFMFFDSGATKSDLRNHYVSNRSIDKESLVISTQKSASLGGIQTFSMYKKTDFPCQIGTKTFIFPSIDIFVEDIPFTAFPVDGTIGRDFMKKSSATIIDLKNMYIDFY